ncbi:probable polygalacturonase At3g15720 [Durio zibethinus]|uniref:Probable polygalacturonase At3g15720 n=1 Tax=Durio zibethinus TaxID=66656 RepID=A0A6P5WKW3_DURZI|nr:probable polygalacturonase At3g15720 [Durio zibethinus]
MATLGYSQTNFDVTSYGAVGDGITDDSQAFMMAWQEACGATSTGPTLYIPNQKTFFLNPIRFEGPCKSQVRVQIMGQIIGPADASAWNGEDAKMWLTFAGVNGLHAFGNGQLDGRGETWWKSCPIMNGCMRPTALAFLGCSNLTVDGLKSINSAQNHLTIGGCENVVLSNLKLSAPDDSPNTDGIKIGSSTNVQVFDSTIGTGDDCIAIISGSSFINISGIACGPGHGISIGSLGKDVENATVEEIHIKDCILNGTDNGARIKTWQGGVGNARKITFENIQLNSSRNPIIIDQFYCPTDGCKNQVNPIHWNSNLTI